MKHQIRHRPESAVNAAEKAGIDKPSKKAALDSLYKISGKFGIEYDTQKQVGGYIRSAWCGWRWKAPFVAKYYDDPTEHEEVQRLYREWVQSELDRKQEEQRKKEQKWLEQERREERERLEQERQIAREKKEAEAQEERERRKRRTLVFKIVGSVAAGALLAMLTGHLLVKNSLATVRNASTILKEEKNRTDLTWSWLASSGQKRHQYYYAVSLIEGKDSRSRYRVFVAIPPE